MGWNNINWNQIDWQALGLVPPSPLPSSTTIYALSINDIYNDVIEELFEPEALQLGLVTESDIKRYIDSTISESLSQSNILKSLFVVVPTAGVSKYDQPSWSTGASNGWYNNDTIFESTGYVWQNTDYDWQLWGGGIPEEWREDNVNIIGVQVRPAPSASGHPITPSTPFYGIISSVSSISDVNISSTGHLIGTIASTDTGDCFVDSPCHFFGTISDMNGSTSNLMFSSKTVQYWDVDYDIPYCVLIGRSLKTYVVAGTLMRIYASDGELKNNMLEKYWGGRYKEGLALLRTLSGEDADVKSAAIK